MLAKPRLVARTNQLTRGTSTARIQEIFERNLIRFSFVTFCFQEFCGKTESDRIISAHCRREMERGEEGMRHGRCFTPRAPDLPPESTSTNDLAALPSAGGLDSSSLQLYLTPRLRLRALWRFPVFLCYHQGKAGRKQSSSQLSCILVRKSTQFCQIIARFQTFSQT